MIALSSTAGMLAAMRSARRIEFCSYYLPSERVESALEAAARRGAEVHVRLEGRLFKATQAMKARNRNALRRLRALHADAELVDRGSRDGPAMHLKAAVCDSTAYLDGCNWNARDEVVRDDAPRDVAAIRRAAMHQPQDGSRALALDKERALELESAVLLHARAKTIDVEAESLYCSPVSHAIRQLAARHVRCRVLISERLARGMSVTITALEKLGVEVRAAPLGEKLAIAGSSEAWIGSANATSTYYNADCIDWGLRTSDARIVKALEARFEANWRRAKIV